MADHREHPGLFLWVGEEAVGGSEEGKAEISARKLLRLSGERE